MNKLFSILLSSLVLAACSSAPKSESVATKITKFNVDQLLQDSTKWVSSDTVIYDGQGRLARVDFFHFGYEEGKVIALCDSVNINERAIRHCQVITKAGEPIKMLVDYYQIPSRAGFRSEGVITSTDSLVTLVLNHYIPGYEQPFNETLKWMMNPEGLLMGREVTYTRPDGLSATNEMVYEYDPASKMKEQDLLPLAFYMQPSSVEDLVMVVAGYLPGMLKDVPTKVKVIEADGKQIFSSEMTPSFDEKGRCNGSKMMVDGDLMSTINIEY